MPTANLESRSPRKRVPTGVQASVAAAQFEGPSGCLASLIFPSPSEIITKTISFVFHAGSEMSGLTALNGVCYLGVFPERGFYTFCHWCLPQSPSDPVLTDTRSAPTRPVCGHCARCPCPDPGPAGPVPPGLESRCLPFSKPARSKPASRAPRPRVTVAPAQHCAGRAGPGSREG